MVLTISARPALRAIADVEDFLQQAQVALP